MAFAGSLESPPADEEAAAPRANRSDGGPTAPRRRVQWYDGTLRRPGWKPRYQSIGARLRSVELPAGAEALGACWIARQDLPSYEPADADTRRVIGMMLKILGRGSLPPLDPSSERRLLDLEGLSHALSPSGLPGDIAPRSEAGIDDVPPPAARPLESLDIGGESTLEDAFLRWAQAELGESARWLVPQPSFDLLLQGRDGTGGACRRCDFLLAAPGGRPFVIEIDGSQHDGQVLSDADRDQLLRSVGIETLRVPAEQMGNAGGPALDRVRSEVQAQASSLPGGGLLWAAVQSHRLVLSLLEAVQAGFLAGDRWVVSVDDPTSRATDLLPPYLQLLDGLDRLWGSRGVAPASVVVASDGSWRAISRQEDGTYAESSADPLPLDARLVLDIDRSSSEPLPEPDDVPTIVVRSAPLPVEVGDVPMGGAERVTVRTAGDATRDALRVILRSVFAKEDFLDGQFEAIAEVLEGRDCTVLLPTGAGKSLIYQLAGLCLPGRTLVIDPIVALIEDQVAGLQANGIDRVVGITSDEVSAGRGDQLLATVAEADAYFVFVAPERLQMQRFRNALRELAAATPVNLAVVDEAHCVSEWGHQFRTSYLTLGPVLRRTCADPSGSPPPLLALTGTASRAVLRDVLFQLGIEQRTERTIIRPSTFDRPELHFRVVRTDSATDEPTLRSVLRAMPEEFGESGQTFFQPNGPSTYSGLVFTPTVNGKHGVGSVLPMVQQLVTSARPYSGKPPEGFPEKDWARVKRANAEAFKDNSAPVLVTTNAFGMGIDKPNIRWVVHYGLPGSIEAYYQEVGRAGRDRDPACCVLVLSEFDADRNAALLSEDLSLDQARERQQSIKWAESDDVASALFFHVGSFPGVDEETTALMEVVDLLEPGDEPRRVEVPFGPGKSSQKARERALHRLVILGVVRDYLVEWGSRQFVVKLAAVGLRTAPDAVVDFVGRTQPGRVDAVRRQLDRAYAKQRESIEAAGRSLITFVYETIERSRRRSLREMWLAARESDGDAEMRRRVLDYLSEGDIAPILERLAEQRPFSFEPWIEQWDLISGTADAREWRGSTGRLLTSYPDHPGLLISRGLAEALDPDGSLRELESNIEAGARSALDSYGLTETDLDSTLEWLLRRCDRVGIDQATAVAGALLSVARESQVATDFVRKHPSRRDDPGLAGLRLSLALPSALTLADEALNDYPEV